MRRISNGLYSFSIRPLGARRTSNKTVHSGLQIDRYITYQNVKATTVITSYILSLTIIIKRKNGVRKIYLDFIGACGPGQQPIDKLTIHIIVVTSPVLRYYRGLQYSSCLAVTRQQKFTKQTTIVMCTKHVVDSTSHSYLFDFLWIIIILYFTAWITKIICYRNIFYNFRSEYLNPF